jgi:hypothetical protein
MHKPTNFIAPTTRPLVSCAALEHLHSFGLPTPKSEVNFVRIGYKIGVGRTSFPAAISGEDADLISKNDSLTKYD